MLQAHDGVKAASSGFNPEIAPRRRLWLMKAKMIFRQFS
jgi:hypothetical protein